MAKNNKADMSCARVKKYTASDVSKAERHNERKNETGVGTAISQELLMGNSEHYGSMVEKLEPGEEKVVTYPYEICSIWFHKKDWENVEKRSFWLTFSSYPDKIVLYL